MLGKRVHPNTKVVIYYWYCEYLDGEEYNADDYENDGVEWVTGEEALRRFTTDVYDPVEKILKDYC
jgi:hypothetical protein